MASRLGGMVLPLLGSWPLCSLGDSTAPAGVTGTQGQGLLASQDPGRADHSALIPRGLPHSGWGLRKVRGVWAGRWQRRRSWGGEGGTSSRCELCFSDGSRNCQ